MRKVIALGLASALAAAALAVPASAQTVTRFSVLSVGVSGHRVDKDTFAFRDRLVQPHNRSIVLGHDEGVCTIRSRSQAHCRVVFYLPAGKIKINGNADFRQHLQKFPVVGGTSAYNGVAGKAVVHNSDQRNTLVDFTLVK